MEKKKATSNTTTKSRSSRNDRAGQSVIEFSIVSMIFVSMLFLSYNAVMAFAFQQYVAHAVFMAARAFQAGHVNPQTQKQAAQATLEAYLPGLNTNKVRLGTSSIRADILSVEVPDAINVPQGSGVPSDYGFRVRVVFEMPLVALPLGDGDWNAVKKIRLEASSFLGREPTQSDCMNYFGQLLKSLEIQGAPGTHAKAMESEATVNAMTDNGC